MQPGTNDVERKRERWLLAFGIAFIFLSISLTLGHFKVLWGDEFVTYWVGQQGSFTGIWAALKSGADPNPPLMHVLSWWSTKAFGSVATAIRLPSVFGVGLALAGVWSIVRRYAGPLLAAAACLALMTSRGFDYSYDARSYGLLMGFAIAALACWVKTLDGKRQGFWFVALAVMLACDLSSNYYGVMAFFPVAAGELLWTRREKRLRLGVWAALLAGALPLLPYLTLIRGNIAEFGPHAWNKPAAGMIAESYFVLVEGLFWPVAIVAAVWLWKRRRQKPNSVQRSAIPAEVRAALWVLMLYPFLGFAIAYGGAGMISARCVIPVCAAFAIVGALLLSQVAGRKVVLGVAAFLLVWVLARSAACAMLLRDQRQAFFHLRNEVDQAMAPGEKLLVGDSLMVMPLWWYASPNVRAGLRFPIDFAAIHRMESDDSGEQNLWGGRHGVFPVPIDKPNTMIEPQEEYIYLGGQEGWLAKELTDRNFVLVPDGTQVNWGGLGGVFTPLAHPTTRVWFVRPR
ncbi:MAG: glycosyltransferase family 39 protein [Acidobacteriaceae bacterium]|nr:glycosyltransferase family 39 protein [Acidobacteriaceae bacterium]